MQVVSFLFVSEVEAREVAASGDGGASEHTIRGVLGSISAPQPPEPYDVHLVLEIEGRPVDAGRTFTLAVRVVDPMGRSADSDATTVTMPEGVAGGLPLMVVAKGFALPLLAPGPHRFIVLADKRPVGERTFSIVYQ